MPYTLTRMHRGAFWIGVTCAAAVIAACAHSRPEIASAPDSVVAATPPKCPAALPGNGLPQLMPASLATMRAFMPGCLNLFAANQPNGAKPVVQSSVPAVQPCAQGTATLRVVAMQYTGLLQSTMYQTRIGQVVAMIQNISGCTPASVQIPPGRTAYWIVNLEVDPKNASAYVPISHVVDAVTEADVPGGGPKYFQQCPADPNPSEKGDVAYFKPVSSICDHQGPLPHQTSGGARGIGAAMLLVTAALPRFDDWSLWISCGAECCYASDI